MARRSLAGGLLVATILLTSARSWAVDLDELRKEVVRIREEIAAQDDPKLKPITDVDMSVYEKYGENQAITTRAGKLTIGGLVHIWYQHIQNDSQGITNTGNDPFGLGIGNTAGHNEKNQRLDNDTYRIRRTELRFALDLTDNISAYVMLDPAREANLTFTPVPTFPNHNSTFGNPSLTDGLNQQSGNQVVPQLLQDAYIEVHDLVPHHDFRFGQFKPPSGEEAWRNSGQLDFVDRAMVTAINNVRDIGVMVHGSWFYNKKDGLDYGRLQYWVGGFNGPDGTVLTDPELVEGGNRSDDNSDKDICWRIAAQPVWDKEKWYGRLEIGAARTDGFRGSAGFAFNPAVGVQQNNLNRERTAINRQATWLWYRPNGPVKGMWIRSEWGSGHDRYSAVQATTLLSFPNNLQTNPAPVTATGWYVASGYKLSQSKFADKLEKGNFVEKHLRNMEFAFRYEEYQNIATESLVQPATKTDLFRTRVFTAGFNYYIKNYNARFQANYFWVNDPEDRPHGLREVKNNMFVMCYQIMF